MAIKGKIQSVVLVVISIRLDSENKLGIKHSLINHSLYIKSSHFDCSI